MKAPIVGGAAQQLASDPATDPFGIVVDGAYVYWTEEVGGTVRAVPLAGGTPITLASGLTTPGGMAINGQYVYWAVAGSSTVSTGLLMRMMRP
jgi:hypothetical protein